MSKTMTASVVWNQRAIDDVKKRVAQGMVAMGYAIAQRARYNAPVLTGALANTIRTEPHLSNWEVLVEAGGVGGVRYARRREFENNAHPWKKHYMRNSLEDVYSGNWLKYFKGRI